MGRLMLSLLLNEQINQQQLPTSPEKIEETVQPQSVPKWSASNAFDPDSDEFWNGEDVVYEAVINPEDTIVLAEEGTVNDRMAEEAALIATGNESQRRRRRENTWEDLDRMLSPLSSGSSEEDRVPSVATAGTEANVMEPQSTSGSNARVVHVDEYERIPIVRVTSIHQELEQDLPPSSDPSLTTRGARVHALVDPSQQHLSQNRRSNSSLMIPGYYRATVRADMLSDMPYRTASPLPLPSPYSRPNGQMRDDVVTSTISLRHSNRPVHRRRASQPIPTHGPTSISLLG